MNSQIVLCQTNERPSGATACLQALAAGGDGPGIKGRQVFIKPNYNTADPAPGSTDNDTLVALVDWLWQQGAASLTLGERSWKNTRQVLEAKGVLPLLASRQVEVILFDDLPAEDWVEVGRPDFHWPQGLKVARPMLEADCLVETACLKTHQYGGVFTMSLKLAVGAVPGSQQMPAYMSALHASPHQRRMIAEINTAFSPELIVLDGVEAFVDGGPMTGKRAAGRVVLAGADRVAIDAVGLACLKRLGANRAIMDSPIFSQEQIARAVELGLGAAGPEAIEILPARPESHAYCQEVGVILAQG